MDYNYDLNKIRNKLNNKNCKFVLLQFPDGFKIYSNEIYDILSKEFPNVDFFIYFGTCFGACDLPLGIPKLDLIVQFGHTRFIKEKW